MTEALQPVAAERANSTYLIGHVAEALGVHPQTLRIYEREGLLRPLRSKGNTRRYSSTDIERLSTILDLTRDKGVNLAGVRVVLDLLDRVSELERRLEPGDF